MSSIPAVNVKRIIVQKIAGCPEMYYRPYQTHISPQAIVGFDEKLNSIPGMMPSNVIGLASEFFAPDAAAESPVPMINGWNSERLAFAIELDLDFHFPNTSTTEWLFGYTNYNGFSDGQFDPAMKWYVNSVIQSRTITRRTLTGQINEAVILHNSQVLAPNPAVHDRAYPDPNSAERAMRPEDTLATMACQHYAEMRGENNFFDARMQLNRALFSQRSRVIPTVYVADMIHNYISAVEASQTLQRINAELDILQEARGLMFETSIVRDCFFASLWSHMQPPSCLNVFNWELLSKIVGDRPLPVPVIRPTAKIDFIVGDEAGDWSMPDMTTRFASILAQAVPACFQSMGFTEGRVSVTNQTETGQIKVDLHNVTSCIPDRPEEMLLALLKHQIGMEIMRDVFGDYNDFAIELDVDVIGLSHLVISLNGQPSRHYVIPSFCDALFSPLITKEGKVQEQVASDFSTLLDTLASKFYR